MLFDLQAALAEILGNAPATLATSATNWPSVADVADVATCWNETESPARVLIFPPQPGASKPIQQNDDPFLHGRSIIGRPLTWTGRVVSLADWAKLSDWEKHGSTDKIWNGLTREWEPQEGYEPPEKT
jgi:hypothetical protein